MSLLELIWWVALVLAGAALLVMNVLVLARLVSARRGRRESGQRRDLVRELLSGARPDLKRLPADVLAGTFVELIRLVRGEERGAFVEQATELGVPEHLGRQLRNGSPRARQLAAQALGQFDSAASLAQLRDAMSDPNPEVRLAAALSLAEHGHEDSVADLVRQLDLGASEESTQIVTLFRMLSAERGEELKALIMAPGTRPGVRLAAIEAFAASGDYSVVPMIVQLALNAPDDAVELPRYLRALGQFAHPAARPAVLDGLARRSCSVRAAAAGAAGKIGLVDLAGWISTMLDDHEWWVRFRAAEALLAFGEPGIELLRTQARDGSPKARHTAASMLAEHEVTR